MSAGHAPVSPTPAVPLTAAGPAVSPTAPARPRPSRGALVTALVVAVVLLLGSVAATVAFAHATAGPSGIARLDDRAPLVERGGMPWHSPGWGGGVNPGGNGTNGRDRS